MLWWCAFLFVLGIIAFLDSIYNYGEIFRRINSVIFMLSALGLLMRVSMKAKIGTIENYIAKIRQLEKEIREIKESGENYTKPIKEQKSDSIIK